MPDPQRALRLQVQAAVQDFACRVRFQGIPFWVLSAVYLPHRFSFFDLLLHKSPFPTLQTTGTTSHCPMPGSQVLPPPWRLINGEALGCSTSVKGGAPQRQVPKVGVHRALFHSGDTSLGKALWLTYISILWSEKWSQDFFLRDSKSALGALHCSDVLCQWG